MPYAVVLMDSLDDAADAAAAERERCLGILRKMQASYDGTEAGRVLEIAIARIERSQS